MVALVPLLVPAAASAAEDLEISQDKVLGGDVVLRNLTITSTGKLTVPKLSTTGTGWLHVKANKIIIFDGGVIQADGAGHAGVSGADGAAPAGSNGGGKYNATLGFPGGGGGFFGAGAPGMQEATPGMCTVAPGSDGGLAFFDMMTASLGAAGGASNPGSFSAAGGAGGGGIVLTAAMIQIDGLVSANGAPAPAASSVAAGGGSGGTIQLEAALITGSGKLEVRGGDGTHGSGSTNPANPVPPNNGGGGSGGVIIVKLPGAKALPTNMTATLSGGLTGDCATTAGPSGMVVQLDIGSACLDLDNDGHTSSLCGGDDCDDTDAAINPDPGVMEICDGKDNDCNNKIDDEGATSLCPPGSSCSSTQGSCVGNTADGGVADGGATDDGAYCGVIPVNPVKDSTCDGGSGKTPDHVAFGGGCSLPRIHRWSDGAAALAAFGAGTLLLGLSRRTRRTGQRRRT